MSLGIEVWAIVEEGYAPKDTDTEKEAKQNFIANAKSMNVPLIGQCETKFIKEMHSETAKYIWATL